VFVGIYLAMGWLGVVPALLVFELLPLAAFMLMLGGGLLYSVGAIFYATNWPNPFPGVFGAHEIWHLFVIGGATSHYLVHLLYLVRM
ncbi:MAG: hemolysin III family protein, partial [Chloroflexi bacterium]|nr:hemolysin III family protein [Chloroflexota bacterium]